MLEASENYCKENDVNPEYILDYKHIYQCASSPSHAQEYLKSLKNIKIREDVVEHRDHVIEIVQELAKEEIKTQFIEDKTVQSLFNKLLKKTNNN